jgi:chromosome segregation ATPase
MATPEELNDALNTPSGELEEEYDPEGSAENEALTPEEIEEIDAAQESTDPLESLLGAEEEPERRTDNRVQRLANERREAKEAVRIERERSDRLEAEINALRQGREAAEQARLQREEEELDPDERRIRTLERELVQTRFQAGDTRDRQVFQEQVAGNPALKALMPDIEKELAVARSKGMNPTREAVAKFILGERAFNRSKEVPGKRRQAQGRVEAARGAPLNARSDASTGRNNDRADTSEARERRLKDIRL